MTGQFRFCDGIAAWQQQANGSATLDESTGAVCQYFRCMVDGMQDQVMVIDRDHCVRDVNSAFLRQMGYTRTEVIGRQCYEVVHGLSEPCPGLEIVCPLYQVWEQGEPIRSSHLLRNQKGDQFYFDVSAFPLHDEQGRVVQVIAACHDVTAERRLEAKLAAIYYLSRELVLSRKEAWIAQAVVNAAQRVLEFQVCQLWLMDESGETLVCRAHAPLAEPPTVSRLPLDDTRGITVAVARTGEAICLPDVSQDPRYVSGYPGTRSELCVPLKVGERVIGVLNAESDRYGAFGEDDHRLLAALADEAALAVENARLFEVTRQQREKLRTLAAWLAEAEEAERRRLARELHDQVGQNLTALSINLNFVRAHAAEGLTDVVRSRLDDSLVLIEQTVECIRSVMADLRPAVLDNHGVVAALRWYGSQIALRTGIAITVQGEEPTPRLAPSVETALFRIVQEALTNVVKHAKATQVTITLEVNTATACLVIADNGAGFDLLRLTGPDGCHAWGLLSMTERAQAVGGYCHILSRPGQGTRVTVEVPR